VKKIFFILSLILLFCSCNRNKTKQSGFHVKLTISDKVPIPDFYRSKGEFYPIRINLINNTDSTMQFWTTSHSWYRNFIFNSDAITIFGTGNDKNSLLLMTLEPGKTLTYNGYLVVRNISSLRKKTDLRLGFVLITENVSNSYRIFSELLFDKKTKKDVIWCDTPLKFDW